ncbi:MAG: hypothetical protein ABH896_00100, partial [Candidatus Jacksonbacteria bacterium]
MDNLDTAQQISNKVFISLSQACEGTPYSQEYLSLRARQGKLKAIKKGRNWVTTKEWLKEYVITSSWEHKKLEFQEAEEKAGSTIFSDMAESVGRGYERLVGTVKVKFKFPSFRFVPIKIPACPPSWRPYYKKAIAGFFVFVVLISGSLLYLAPNVRASFGNWAQTTLLKIQTEVVYSVKDFIRGTEQFGKDTVKFAKSAPQIPQSLFSWSKIFWQGYYEKGQVAGESIIKEESTAQGSASHNFVVKGYNSIKNKFQLLPEFFKQSVNKFSSLFGQSVFEFNEIEFRSGLAEELPSSLLSDNVFDDTLPILPSSSDRSDYDYDKEQTINIESEKLPVSTKLTQSTTDDATIVKIVEKVVEVPVVQEKVQVVEKVIEKQVPVVLDTTNLSDTVITGVLGVTDSINTPQLSVTGSFYGQTASLGNLTVRDDLTLKGGADVGGSLQIAGDLTVEGTARMNGDFYLKGVYVDDVNSTRVITNYIQGGSAGFSGAVGITTLGVGGDASFGASSSDDFIVKSTADFQGPITGTLNLSNLTSFRTPYQQTLTVAKRGGDYTTITGALSSISGNGALTAYIGAPSGAGVLSAASPASEASAETYKITFSSATEFSAVNSAGEEQGNGTISSSFTTADTYLTISSSSWTGVWAASDTLEIAVRPKSYLIEVYPGTYPESITMKSYVDIVGVEGQENTKIARYDADLITSASNAKIEGFTLELRGATAARSVINVGATSPNLKNLAVNGGSTTYATGISVSTGSPIIEDVNIASTLNGVKLTGTGAPTVRRVEVTSTINDVVVSGAGTLTSHNNRLAGGAKFVMEDAGAIIESTGDIYQGVTFTAAGAFRDLTNTRVYTMAQDAVAVGEAVCLSGDDIVALAQADSDNSPPTMPAIGIAVKKLNSTSILVQTVGIFYDYAISKLSDLTSGSQYYVSKSTAGALTATKPGGMDAISQVVGVAKSANELVLVPPSQGLDVGGSGSATSPYARVVNVAVSGGDYSSIQEALDDITNSSAGVPYLIRVFPGVYGEQITINNKSYIDIIAVGGSKVTKIAPAAGTA